MQRRKFGDTELEVSAIALGCWIFGVDWWGHYTQDDCNRICSFSLDQGVTFFDNGDAYGNGRAETLFGQWMKDAKIDRSKIEIGGKFGYDFYTDPGEPGSHKERKQDFSPGFMRVSTERALNGSAPITSIC
jgi:aryl-alcohol dehydrogenase-like predicted oxidoreductase